MTGAHLADGASAAANTEAYVRAYGQAREAADHTGLTGDGIRECYRAEEGLSLPALEADSAALAKAGLMADEALALHREALAIVTENWRSESGSAATTLLRRHCAEGSEVVSALYLAAEELSSLREQLGQLVEAKVDAAIRIDDRRAAERPLWLAHVRAALDTGDPIALQAVEREIAPYVASDIQFDWMDAMRSATDSVGSAYEQASARLSDRPSPRFDLPPALGGMAEAAPIWSGPAPAQLPPAWASGVPAPMGSVPSGVAPASSALAGALPALGGAVAGLIAQVAEALGPDIGPPTEVPGEGLGGSLRHPDPQDESAPSDRPVERSREGSVAPLEPDRSAVRPPVVLAQPDGQLEPEGLTSELLAAERPPESGAQVPTGSGAQPSPPPTEAPSSPLPLSAPVDIPAAEGEQDEVATPCEIAADELPQVGR